ncbi:GNAT family N-acetyltransferase [Pseudoalteromonas sp. Ld20]|uniref:GNAT family N-acetyltransferase n=1 Tax=Pseudoalteromonas sp. Ld20 TaxID=649165 RepID=UPI003864CB94
MPCLKTKHTAAKSITKGQHALEQSLKLIEFFNNRFIEGVGIRWGIHRKDTGKLIGTCGFNSWNQKMKNAGIGYELSSKHWGYGYATQALHKIIDSAFSDQLPFGELYRVQAETIPKPPQDASFSWN